MIRTARPADGPVLRALQGLLPERAPALLHRGIEQGTALVSTADLADGPDRSAGSDGSDASDALGVGRDRVGGDRTGAIGDPGVPVGYLLPIYGEDVHVAELAVAPRFRREGRATALFEALFATLAPGRRVTIAVDPDNEAGLSLYRSLGFATYDRREEYFDSGPALLLERVATGAGGSVFEGNSADPDGGSPGGDVPNAGSGGSDATTDDYDAFES